MIKRILFPLSLSVALTCTTALGQTKEPIDDEAVTYLREQGLEHSAVMDHLSWMCDVHGPRLTASPGLRRAQDWAVEVLRGWGLDDARLEEWGPFGRGWQLDHFHMDVVGENPWPVHAWPKAWSPSTKGQIESEVVYVGGLGPDDIAALDLAGKIVMVQEPREVSEPFEAPARRQTADDLLAKANGARSQRSLERAVRSQGVGDYRRRSQVLRLVYEKKPLAIIDRSSKGDYGTIFVSSASTPSPAPVEGEEGRRRSRGPRAWDPAATGVIPQVTLAVEHYNRLQRMIEKGVSVRIALDLRVRFFDDDLMERNVVADIPGTDPEIGDQVVMLGAHFDSWHSSTGATDNGAGSAVMMEAMRLLRKMMVDREVEPRRTIRIGLWSGEEQGLLGSRAYVTEHFGPDGEPTEEHAKFSGYFNLDNGTGKVRGIYLQGNSAIDPVFRAWLRPFHDLDASTVTLSNTGGTDHGSFDRVRLPGFQFIQDPVAYNTQTHHSNMDNWDHAVAEDLQQAATIIASFAWHAAQRDELLPRKAPREAPSGRGAR